MTNYNIIGREHEQAVIRSYIDSGKSELIAVYGRRRVGKTYLVKSIFHNDFDFPSFRAVTKTRKVLHHTFVTTYGVARNLHSGIVQSEVLMDDLFL